MCVLYRGSSVDLLHIYCMYAAVSCVCVCVSYTGGRQLDYAPSAVEMLPAVMSVVAGRVPVIVVSPDDTHTNTHKASATINRHETCISGVVFAWAD